MEDLYPNVFLGESRAMLFVDGESLAIRYGEMRKTAIARTGKEPVAFLATGTPGPTWYEPDVAVWAQCRYPHPRSPTRLVRRHYYTSIGGDAKEKDRIAEWLKGRQFEAPRVFHRDKQRGSKQVDISLATDMLTHAHRKHYEIAILVAGDADYCPLVRAVKAEGARVHIWSLSSGLSPLLRVEADHFVDLDSYFGL